MRGKRKENDDDNGFAEWGGYMEAKKAKLRDQFTNETAKQVEKQSDIFAGISIYVNGHTKPTAQELKVLMAQHGGTFHLYHLSSTTYMIASNLPNVKVAKLGTTPIVKPNWITDSIKFGRLLDYSKYLLYTKSNRTQPQLRFESTASTANTKTASHPDFLEDFYSRSRLHLISNLGAEYKQLINEWRQNSNQHRFPGRERLQKLFGKQTAEDKIPKTAKATVMHIDMDCFFVSVALRERNDLRGKPVAVTHSKGSAAGDAGDKSLAEIASCSYEARQAGVKNGMFMGQALKLCPDLLAVPYDFEGYKQVSRILYETIAEYTLNIEAVSCDELYAKVDDVLGICGISVQQWAQHIRGEIKERTGCPCSTGFGANRLQARMATKRAKPDGQFHLEAAAVEEYMRAVHLGDLPGIGRATLGKLRERALETCGDLLEEAADDLQLQKELGAKVYKTLLEQCRGIDSKGLQYEHERKSVSAEVNYGIRFETRLQFKEFLQRLSEEVTRRLRDAKMKTRCVTLKLMVRAADAPVETAKYLGHGQCDAFSKSVTLQKATDEAAIIQKQVLSILEKMPEGSKHEELRGIGIQLSKLEKTSIENSINPLLKSFLQMPSVAKTEKNESKKLPETLQNKVSSAPTLMQFFKTTQRDRTELKKADNKLQEMKIDPKVLSELPVEIQNEIKEAYGLNLKEQTVEKPNVLLEENKELENQEENKSEKKNALAALGKEAFLEMLRKWTASERKPSAVDVEMLAMHLQQSVAARKIEIVYLYMKSLHRLLMERGASFEWQEAYRSVNSALQQKMVSIYGKKMLLPSL